jgi:hypothetical protein
LLLSAQCVLLLKHDPDNEEASVMLAELMFHKVVWGSRVQGLELWGMTICTCLEASIMLAQLMF